MDTQLDYSQISKYVLKEYDNFYKKLGFSSLRLLFDDLRQSYMLLDIGWYDKKYIHNATIHLEIINGKIWIQHDGTDPGIALDLEEAGVPRKDIVLGFRPPHVCQYTGYGT